MARFGEIKGEKIVIVTSGEKTIAHACFQGNPILACITPIGKCMPPLPLGIWHKITTLQRL